MHANVYSFWGQVEPRTEPSQQQRERKSREGEGERTEREGERESKREQITARLSSYSFCCSPTQLKHERILNQHDSGGKVKKKNHAVNAKASRGKDSSLL